ncbi:2,3-diphosphoglycerate-dependent phosphoglycerate mutase [Patescibacteria group bacterium]|nr:2,3-diphosphoglycerate-dependent phosphoglycerate mutase [Patescibacteria group bacterium]MCL5409576.1 2,3-diphosphoglycerate-dependent phosphoglycerate mutase [Patescibacteria group bacterium]
MAYLALVRHGESVWNAKGLWTGWTDVDLSDKGRQEAREAAEQVKSIKFDICYTSVLKRAIQTWEVIKDELDLQNIPVIADKALNERNYGILTGQNKWNIKEQFGENQFTKWRRGWDEPIQDGETLKDVYERVVPYFQEHILVDLKNGKNVLVSAHGNSLRALVKYLDNIPDDQISKFELATGQVYVYQFDDQGEITSREIKSTQRPA